MTTLRTSKTTTHADELIASVLDQLGDESATRQARAIVARLNRTYSHAIIDGTEFVLVPAAQSPPRLREAA